MMVLLEAMVSSRHLKMIRRFRHCATSRVFCDTTAPAVLLQIGLASALLYACSVTRGPARSVALERPTRACWAGRHRSAGAAATCP
eukprot:scaffold1200_cov383-Prasinococcus_capsulatus_cf.AAC.4